MPDDHNLTSFPALRQFRSPAHNYNVVVQRPVVTREDTARQSAKVVANQESGFASVGLVKCSVPAAVTIFPSVYYSGDEGSHANLPLLLLFYKVLQARIFPPP